METITYLKLTEENVNVTSLDNFKRFQKINECWRKIDNQYVLVKNEFIEDWDSDKLRSVAKDMLKAISKGSIAYGAFYKNEVVGFIYLSDSFFGSENQYIELVMLQVSEPFRRSGIGKELFKLACEAARKTKAAKLYISAHSSKESQAFYRKLGCIEASEINTVIAESEPFDVQMEYEL